MEHGKLTKGRPVTPQLVGVDDDWDVLLTQEPNEEGLGRFSVPVPLEEHVQHNAVFIDGAPQPVGDTTDVHVHFIEVPPGTLGELGAELDASGANGLASHADSSFQQEFFNIPVAQDKAVVKQWRRSR